MKKWYQIAVVVFTVGMLASCTSFKTPIKKMMAVEKGMTKNQIVDVLGSPSYRSFNDEKELWEFRQFLAGGNTSVILITFIDGRVEKMDTFEELPFRESECEQGHPKKGN
ncbi:MAG: outer membrane protein assembly factor BamE [Bacteroidia bacterium]|nr:outer membrane protein assembly factor BamE [Bacteroidia bacterium]